MGYYDGVAGTTTHASAYEIAQITDTPVVLVVDGKKSSLSLAAMVKGFLEYRTDSHIGGVILNKVSPGMAERLRPCLEELGIRMYGALPFCEEAKWESRHLGLTLPEEQGRLREKVEALADRLEPCLDVEGLLELAGTAPPVHRCGIRPPLPGHRGKELRNIAVARDEAFCFIIRKTWNCWRGMDGNWFPSALSVTVTSLVPGFRQSCWGEGDPEHMPGNCRKTKPCCQNFGPRTGRAQRSLQNVGVSLSA